jgi:hypothetical protein
MLATLGESKGDPHRFQRSEFDIARRALHGSTPKSLLLGGAGSYAVRPARDLTVTVWEPGLQTPLPKALTSQNKGKIRKPAHRGEVWQTSRDRQMLDYAIAEDEAGVYCGYNLSSTLG